MNKLLRKLLSVSLCAALIGGTAAALPVFVPDSGITASAAPSSPAGDIAMDGSRVIERTSDGGFQYSDNGDNTLCVYAYTGLEENITIPSKVEGKVVSRIGGYAFLYCKSLKTIKIPESVKSIGYCAFMGCTSLTSITIPSSVTSIGSYAFRNCSSLTSITIPSSVTSIGEGAFSGCSSLASIIVDNNNSEYSSADGILYNKDKTKLICCPGGKKTANNIPSSVTSIEDGSLYGCSSLTSIIVDNNNSEYSSADGILYNKDKTELICCPGGKKTANNIPSSVTSIGYCAFMGCTSLTSVTIPDSVTSIGYDAFYGCSSLASIVVDNNNSEYSSADGILYNKNKTKLLFCPKGKKTANSIPSSVTSIENSAFSGCSSLTSITIPSSVTSIINYMFSGCSSLTSITIPDGVTSIENSAFSGCNSLKSIKIPSSVTSIGYNAFTNYPVPIGEAYSGCGSLTSIIVDDNNSIYSSVDGILYDKDKTTLIICPVGKTTANQIPSSVTSIVGNMFSGCKSLTSVTIPSGVTSIRNYMFSGCESLTSIKIPNSVTSIENSAFKNCSSLTSVTIPSSVTSIGDYAFSDCSSLTSVNIPSSVTSIGWDAFSGCTSLTSITIPNSVTSIGSRAFGYKWNKNKYEYEKIDGFTIYGKTGSAAETYANDNGFKFVSTAADTALKNSSSISATNVTAGTEVTLTGKATGGKAPYKFAYYYKKSTDSTWTRAYTTPAGNAYTKNTSVSFKPTTAGTYNVRINAKDDKGTVVAKELRVTVTAALTNKSTVSATTVKAGTEVTMTGKATGGTSPYKYAYYYKKSTDSTWTRAYTTPAGNAYTKNTSVSFKPTTAGTYNVRINAKDDKGTVVAKELRVTVTAALTNKSTVSATTVKAGTEVTMTGKATGGTSPYKFAYYYKKSTDSSWTKAYVTSSGSAYTKYDSKTFTPKTAGTYNVKINVKDQGGNGTMVSKEFTVKVTADTSALTNNSTISATTVKAGTEVTMTGKATGGTSPYKFAYYYKKSTDSSWTKAYVTSSGSAYTKYDSKTFTPKTAGTYYVRINVKDKYGEGEVVSKDFKLTVK